jgi:hypothetical protein
MLTRPCTVEKSTSEFWTISSPFASRQSYSRYEVASALFQAGSPLESCPA